MIRQPFTERDIQRIARHKSIQHYKPRQPKLSITRRRFLLLALAVLLVVAVLLAAVTPTAASARPPLCRVSASGMKAPVHYALPSTWWMHVRNGAKPAIRRNGAWSCK